jgi:hypothetical protein
MVTSSKEPAIMAVPAMASRRAGGAPVAAPTDASNSCGYEVRPAILS